MTTPIPAIEGKTTVTVGRDRAFELFTGHFGAWWPRQYHIGATEVADVILEPHEGGRWFERGVDGSACDWSSTATSSASSAARASTAPSSTAAAGSRCSRPTHGWW